MTLCSLLSRSPLQYLSLFESFYLVPFASVAKDLEGVYHPKKKNDIHVFLRRNLT